MSHDRVISRINALLNEAVDMGALRSAAAKVRRDGGYGRVFVKQETGDVWYMAGDWYDNADIRAARTLLSEVPGVRRVDGESESKPSGDGWQLVEAARPSNQTCPGCGKPIAAHDLSMSLFSTYKGQAWHQDCAQTAYRAAKAQADAGKADRKQQAVVQAAEELRTWADSLEVRRALGTGTESYAIYKKGTSTTPIGPPTLKPRARTIGIASGFVGPPVFTSKAEAQATIDQWRKEAELTYAAFRKKHRLA